MKTIGVIVLILVVILMLFAIPFLIIMAVANELEKSPHFFEEEWNDEIDYES